MVAVVIGDAWANRIARISERVGVQLSADAVEPATTLNIGAIPADVAGRLISIGRARVVFGYPKWHSEPQSDDRSAWRIHVEISDADDGEPVLAYTDTDERPVWAGREW